MDYMSVSGRSFIAVSGNKFTHRGQDCGWFCLCGRGEEEGGGFSDHPSTLMGHGHWAHVPVTSVSDFYKDRK